MRYCVLAGNGCGYCRRSVLGKSGLGMNVDTASDPYWAGNEIGYCKRSVLGKCGLGTGADTASDLC